MKISPLRKVTKYTVATVEELKKASWPNRQELIRLTSAVITGFILLAFFVAVTDVVFQAVVRFLLQP